MTPYEDAAALDARRSAHRRYGWLSWAIGAALFPVGALLVPHGTSPMTLANFLDGTPGIVLWGVWALGIAAMFFGMCLLRGAPLRQVLTAQLTGGILIAALTTATPSTDPYAYFVYGRWQATGVNPWHPPPLRASDPDATWIATMLHNPPVPSVYGPAFVGFESALYRLAPSAPFATWVWMHRALMLLAAALVTGLVRGPRIAYWGLNPLIMLEFAVAGHNDALMLAFVALAMRVRIPLLAGMLAGVAGMVKLPALVVAVFLRKPVLSAVGAAFIVAALVLAYPHALTSRALAMQTHLRGNSPVAALEKLLIHAHVPHADLIAAALILAAIALVMHWSGHRWSRRNGPAAASLALLAVTPYLQSWYLTWPLMCAPWISRKLRLLVLTAGALAWLQDLGTISKLPLHVSTAGFWLPLIALTLWLYVVPRIVRGHAIRPRT